MVIRLSANGQPSHGFPNRIAAAAGLIALAALGGCTTTQNEYAGSALPDSAVAIVEVGSTQVFDGTTPLAVEEIDGAEHAGGGLALDHIVPLATQDYKLRPGAHAFVFDVMATKGLFDVSAHSERFEVSAILQANKRYRFIGRREPLSVKGLVAGVLSGDMPVHVELVNETDGGTVRYDREVPLSPGYQPLIGPQRVAAYPDTGVPANADIAPTPLAPPPPLPSFDSWAKQNPDAVDGN